MNAELKTHKDLDAWKRSLDLVETVYKVTKAFPQEELARPLRLYHLQVEIGRLLLLFLLVNLATSSM